MTPDSSFIQAPAENPPYLTSFGIAVTASIFIEIAFSILCFAYAHLDPAVFLAAVAASKILLLAFANFRLIAAWRSIRNGLTICKPSISSYEMTQNSSFTLKLDIDYPLTYASTFEAFHWTHTDNLVIQCDQNAVQLTPCSQTQIQFTAQTLHSGYGKILGLAMVTASPLRCFRAENHIEFNLTFSILPKNIRKKRFKFAAISPLERKLQQAITSQSDADPQELRPWQNTDAIRRIAWKYYAKSGKLMARQNPQKTPPTLLCLLDAGPSMRLTRPDHDACICMAISLLASVSDKFQTLSVIAYDETDATVIAENVPPDKCIKKLKTWLLKTLEWNPECLKNTQAWNDAIQMLHNDFRLYKRVNFTQKNRNRIILDNKALAEWAKSDLALTALTSHQPEKAAQILKLPARQVLISLIKQRSRTTQPPLMPTIPPPMLPKAAEKWIQTPASSTLIWFTDFAAPLTAETLTPFVQKVKKQRAQAFAVCLPPPLHALNYIASHGENNRALATQYLKKYMTFIDNPMRSHTKS